MFDACQQFVNEVIEKLIPCDKNTLASNLIGSNHYLSRYNIRLVRFIYQIVTLLFYGKCNHDHLLYECHKLHLQEDSMLILVHNLQFWFLLFVLIYLNLGPRGNSRFLTQYKLLEPIRDFLHSTSSYNQFQICYLLKAPRTTCLLKYIYYVKGWTWGIIPTFICSRQHMWYYIYFVL